MPELITSTSNPKIKKLLALQQKSSERRGSGLFVVEGRRELERCLAAGFHPDTVFLCPSIYYASEAQRWGPTSGTVRGAGEAVASGNRATLGNVRGGTASEAQRWGPTKEDVSGGDSLPSVSDNSFNGAKVIEVSEEIYDKIAYRGGTEGIIAEIKAKQRSLSDLQLSENPLVIILESVEKPGNLGAVIRSADAAGADAVIICDPLTDLYNPNLIRASTGGIFTVPCAAANSEDVIKWLKALGISILTAQLQDSVLYYDFDMRGPTAIVIGTEATGLTDIWREAADAHIRIPMLGALDSLNASVSAAILLFEAVRQRGVNLL